MQWSPLRLVQKRWKALYIVGGFIVTFLLFQLLDLVPSTAVAATLSTIIQGGWIYFGTRTFRGRDEVLNTPRAWWRVTARPVAGFLLSALFVYSTVTVAIDTTYVDEFPVSFWLGVLEFGGFAVLYAASSIRLIRQNKVAATNPTT